MFGISLNMLEKIPPVHVHPSKRSLQMVRIDIPLSKEDSKMRDQEATEPVKVYTQMVLHKMAKWALQMCCI
jgi:hypothetical protein